MNPLRCFVRWLMILFVLPLALLAQAPLSQMQPDALAILASPAAVKLFPPSKLEFPKFDTLPAEVEVSDVALFRTVQYIRALRPKGLKFKDVEYFYAHALKDASLSREEALILESFARNAPLTVKSTSTPVTGQPVPLIPQLTEPEMARIREFQANPPTLTTPQVVQARFLQPGTARAWLKLYGGTAEEKAVAVAGLRMVLLRFENGTPVRGNYLGEPMYPWYNGLDPREMKQVYRALHEDMIELNARYTPALFSEYALQFMQDLANGTNVPLKSH